MFEDHWVRRASPTFSLNYYGCLLLSAPPSPSWTYLFFAVKCDFVSLSVIAHISPYLHFCSIGNTHTPVHSNSVMSDYLQSHGL